MFFLRKRKPPHPSQTKRLPNINLKKLKTQCPSAFHLRAWDRHWLHSQILPTLTGGKENKHGKYKINKKCCLHQVPLHFSNGLGTVLGRINSYVSRKLHNALCVLTIEVSPPHHRASLSGHSLFVCSIKSKNNGKRQFP